MAACGLNGIERACVVFVWDDSLIRIFRRSKIQFAWTGSFQNVGGSKQFSSPGSLAGQSGELAWLCELKRSGLFYRPTGQILRRPIGQSTTLDRVIAG